MVCSHKYLKLVKWYLFMQKESKVQHCSYRSMSLQSTIYKILERLVYNYLYNFLEMNILIYDLQFSF